MRVAVHGRLRHKAGRPGLLNILKNISGHFKDVRFSTDLAAVVQPNSKMTVDDRHIGDGSIDMLISVGGDGTILECVRKVGRSGTPILGVNTGRMGFLASTPNEELDNALGKVLAGDFYVDKRALVKVVTDNDLFGEQNFALNEVGVHKSATSSMIAVQAYLDNLYLNTYWADGLIVSTPTGSTGYSLSAGGPIMAPSTDNLVITPIAPHNLNVRPLVINQNHEITLRVENSEQNILISLDSDSRVVDNQIDIRISQADFKVGLIRFGPQDYFDTLRNKLMWGLDRRN